MPVSLTIDGKQRTLAVADDMPLLWALRDIAGVTGVKFGCGAGLCGACSVLVDGERLFACQTPVSAVAGKAVTTVEGLTGQPLGQALAAAWEELDVVQCGYCQPGQIVAAAALLKANPKPDDAAIDAGMSGNICRCGTYNRIRAAIHRAADTLPA
ncbi:MULTISPECIES: (2Fe-2S)-binding protein [unclassified Novosphingobium]|uniref:(2Fe-2S)-binding protein n=1 Tax=Novosphingobium TaxID=165696 RepID=UPI0014456E74|nr:MULTISPECIES: (2Fe-2S)-binding protein [unclassified Novosphingobium]NKJ40916.1 isoquinoline 1-oxidoreductase alpha subunit [Novosphingobium sp. SG720]NMN03160.1 isoquinoline 1-oxidoreductase alpha subunit [Novosphingobium sp. SG919]NMN86850.1 isoquinoline 1-oxidoreductase alpha subunit [Novosphingobium sp. SG916]